MEERVELKKRKQDIIHEEEEEESSGEEDEEEKSNTMNFEDKSNFNKNIDNNKLILDLCKQNEVEKVKFIIDNNKDCDINFQDKNTGITPLIQACMSNNNKLIRLLLSRGSKQNIKDKKKNIALFYCKNYDSILLMIKNGSNRYAIGNEGKTFKESLNNDVIYEKVKDIPDTIFESIIKLDIDKIKDFFDKGGLATFCDNSKRELLQIFEEDCDSRNHIVHEAIEILTKNYCNKK